MLFSDELAGKLRAIAQGSEVDSTSFNNDNISYLAAREGIRVLEEHAEMNVFIIDVVVNFSFVAGDGHSELVRLLLQWKSH
jgi:hypothetical protein